MSELLPCPFCGGEVELVGINVQRQKMMFVCGKCNAEVVLTDDVEWNYRHYPPEVEKAVERMKPKKVIPEKVYWAPKNRRAYFIRFVCPTCGGIANRATNRTFCNNNGCGQALDWEV
jgi:predicted RNA-binding Zn-ribbon protein involved in translation (DUF1610 family)